MAMFSANFRKKLKSEIKFKRKTLQVMWSIMCLITCYGRVYNLKNPLLTHSAGQHVMASMLFFT